MFLMSTPHQTGYLVQNSLTCTPFPLVIYLVDASGVDSCDASGEDATLDKQLRCSDLKFL